MPTLIAAEFPILAVEATLAALTSFTLIGPLGLPWWLRKLPPQAFVEPLPSLPTGEDYGLRISSLIPRAPLAH